MSEDEQKRLDQFEDSFGRVQGTVQDHAFKLSELEKKLTTFQTKYPYTTALENSRKIAELEQKVNKNWNLNQEIAQEILPNELEKLEKKIKDKEKNWEVINKQWKTFQEGLEELEKKLERSYTCPFDCEKAIEELEKKQQYDAEEIKEELARHIDLIADLEKKTTIIVEDSNEVFKKHGERIEKLDGKSNKIWDDELGKFEGEKGKGIYEDGEKEPTDYKIHQLEAFKKQFYESHVLVEKADLKELLAIGYAYFSVNALFRGKNREESIDKLREKYLKEDADE